MKNRLIKFIITGVITLAVITVFIVLSTAKEKSDCPVYAYDSGGRILNAHHNESDGLWYLFVTSTDDISELDVYFNEKIEAAEKGVINNNLNCIENPFDISGSDLEVKTESGKEYKIQVMQSTLPSVYIDLTDTDLNEIHLDKNKVYYGNSIYISSLQKEYNVSLKNAVEIKGRGNSTWTFYDKKGYQIRFSENIPLMGMSGAKEWVLLANAGDDSMMRSKLAYDMAQNLDMPFVPEFEYVDLWIDGDYRGTYLLGEKIEISAEKVNLQDAKGAIFEHDEGFYMEKEYFIFNEMLQRHFTVKDVVKNNKVSTEETLSEFSKAVDKLCNYLYTTPVCEVSISELSNLIDVESFIKYYLINEYVLNRESFVSSFYWYKDGVSDLIHLGPIWDFDTSMGNDLALYSENYGNDHVLFKYLLAGDEFYNEASEIYETYKQYFTSMAQNTELLYSEIKSSAEMNYKRWDVLGKANPKGGVDFSESFDKAVDSVNEWLKLRSEAFKVEKCNAVTSTVSEDCRKMYVNFDGVNDHSSIKFAVWSMENGNDDLHWYNAYKNSDGSWNAEVDLSLHNSSGIYRIAVYGEDLTSALTAGYSYVETATEPLYKMQAINAENNKSFDILLEDSGLHNEMCFAVWSDEDAQDDLIWYEAEKNSENLWAASVKFENHPGMLIHVHAYSEIDGVSTFIYSISFEVSFS